MIRRSYSPKAYISKDFVSKVRNSESVIGVPMFRKSCSPMDDQIVQCSVTIRFYDQIDIIELQKDFSRV